MRVVPIRHAANRMTEDLDRRFRHVLVVVRRRSFSQIFQHPQFLFTGLYILLWPDSRQFAQELKLFVGTRSATGENWFVRLRRFRSDALQVSVNNAVHRPVKLLVGLHAAVVQPTVPTLFALTVWWLRTP